MTKANHTAKHTKMARNEVLPTDFAEKLLAMETTTFRKRSLCAVVDLCKYMPSSAQEVLNALLSWAKGDQINLLEIICTFGALAGRGF